MSRAEDLAAQFEAVNAALIDAVENCSADQWGSACTAEGWSAAVVAHHVAGSHEPIARIVQGIATGTQLPVLTGEMLAAANAQHAQAFAGVSKEDTLDLLRSGGTQAGQAVRDLSDAQLDATATRPLLSADPISADQAIRLALIGHPQEHLDSFNAAASD